MKSIIFTTAGILLSACSHYYSTLDKVSEHTDVWLKQHEYHKITKTLELVSPTHPDYLSLQVQLRNVKELSKIFEQKIINDAAQYEKNNEWKKASDAYLYGLDKLPESNRIRIAQEQFLLKRKDIIELLNFKIMISQAKYLPQQNHLYHEILALIPDESDTQGALGKNTELMQATARSLLDCGKHALKINDHVLAEQCLSLVPNLKPDAALKKELNRVIATHLNRDWINKSTLLFHNYNDNFDKGDYVQARFYLDELASLRPGNKRTIALRVKLDKALLDQIQLKSDEARQQYSLGKINDAIDTWSFLLQLDPENSEFKENISRARKKAEKIRELGGENSLKGKQTGAT